MKQKPLIRYYILTDHRRFNRADALGVVAEFQGLLQYISLRDATVGFICADSARTWLADGSWDITRDAERALAHVENRQ